MERKPADREDWSDDEQQEAQELRRDKRDPFDGIALPVARSPSEPTATWR
jgi:hypothetical protein